MRHALLAVVLLSGCGAAGGYRASGENERGLKLLKMAEAERSPGNLPIVEAAVAAVQGNPTRKSYGALLSEAATAFGNAVRLHPDNAEYHYNLARTLAAQGLYAPALVQYGEAARIDPLHKDASARMERLSRYVRSGEIDAQAEAIADALRY